MLLAIAAVIGGLILLVWSADCLLYTSDAADDP